MISSLTAPPLFFMAARESVLGPTLSPEEVAGCNAVLTACDGLPMAHAAYALATAFHETAHTLQPVPERGSFAYLSKYDTGLLAERLGNTPAADGDGQRFAGRGYVQLTGHRNYLLAGTALGVDLVGDPDLALRPDIAARVLRRGMVEGWFTGKSFKTYLPDHRPATRDEFVAARRIINGVDKASLIATYALAFQAALHEGGWA